MTSYARLQNAAAATGNGAALPVQKETVVAFQVTGTFVATVNFEGSVDGVNFVPVEASPLGGGPPSVNATAPGVWQANCAALLQVRATVTPWTSGTVTVDALATQGTVVEAEQNYARVAATQFARPADTTAYAIGDLVANSLTAGSVVPLAFSVTRVVVGGNGVVKRARVKKSSNTITVSQFRLHLYALIPTVTNGDNGVWLSSQGANYLGSIDVTADRAFSDGAAGWGVPSAEIVFRPTTGIIYGLLEARAAYVPTSGETFDVALDVLQS